MHTHTHILVLNKNRDFCRQVVMDASIAPGSDDQEYGQVPD